MPKYPTELKSLCAAHLGTHTHTLYTKLTLTHCQGNTDDEIKTTILSQRMRWRQRFWPQTASTKILSNLLRFRKQQELNYFLFQSLARGFSLQFLHSLNAVSQGLANSEEGWVILNHFDVWMNLCKAKPLPGAAPWTSVNDSAAHLQVLLTVWQQSSFFTVSPEVKNWLKITPNLYEVEHGYE